jgi:hypothetical protein
MIKRADPWNDRSAISRWAHVFERIGLALAGGSCGLFVAADVARVDVGLLSSPVAILAIMLYGAAGFYVGIDLPPAPPGSPSAAAAEAQSGFQGGRGGAA